MDKLPTPSVQYSNNGYGSGSPQMLEDIDGDRLHDDLLHALELGLESGFRPTLAIGADPRYVTASGLMSTITQSIGPEYFPLLGVTNPDAEFRNGQDWQKRYAHELVLLVEAIRQGNVEFRSGFPTDQYLVQFAYHRPGHEWIRKLIAANANRNGASVREWVDHFGSKKRIATEEYFTIRQNITCASGFKHSIHWRDYSGTVV